MRLKTTILSLTLCALSFFTIESYCQEQERPLMSKEDHERMDSLEAVNKKEQQQIQQAKDKTSMANMKNSKRETKAKAKEAQRVEAEANDAAKQSKNAFRTEKKAQKVRKQADRQAQKAVAARIKSDKN